MKKLLLLLALIISMVSCVCAAEQKSDNVIIVGVARVIDGDSIVVDNHKIRLDAIDAPELKQSCQYKDSLIFYQCGMESKHALQVLVRDKVVTCYQKTLDIYRRALCVCFVDGINVNRFMISTGNAVLYKSASAYKQEQESAKQNKLGVWDNYFQSPYLWRQEQKLKAKAARAARVSKTIN